MSNKFAPIPSALVVDDQKPNTMLFSRALESSGFNVEVAFNGADALDRLDQTQFDLLVLDMQMPIVDGRTVLKKLRTNGAHAEMVVVICTANPHMVTNDIEDLADYVFHKPLDIDQFICLTERIAGNVNRSALA